MSSSTIDRHSHCPPPRPGMSTRRNTSLARRYSISLAAGRDRVVGAAGDDGQAHVLGASIARVCPISRCHLRRTDLVEEIRDDPPVPTLMLANRARRRNYWEVWGKAREERVDVGLLGYAYGETLIGGDDARLEQRRVEDGRIVVRRRDVAAERSAQNRLEAFGLCAIETFGSAGEDGGRIPFAFLDSRGDWPGFVFDTVPQLEREGWRIESRTASATASSMAAASGRPRSRRVRLVVFARSRDRDRWGTRASIADAHRASISTAPHRRAGRTR